MASKVPEGSKRQAKSAKDDSVLLIMMHSRGSWCCVGDVRCGSHHEHYWRKSLNSLVYTISGSISIPLSLVMQIILVAVLMHTYAKEAIGLSATGTLHLRPLNNRRPATGSCHRLLPNRHQHGRSGNVKSDSIDTESTTTRLCHATLH